MKEDGFLSLLRSLSVFVSPNQLLTWYHQFTTCPPLFPSHLCYPLVLEIDHTSRVLDDVSVRFGRSVFGRKVGGHGCCSDMVAPVLLEALLRSGILVCRNQHATSIFLSALYLFTKRLQRIRFTFIGDGPYRIWSV